MVCINPDGSITESAKALMRIIGNPLTLEEIYKQSGQPISEIRSNLREMVSAGLVNEEGNGYVVTEKGKKEL